MIEYLKRSFFEGSQVTNFNLMTASIIGSSAHFLFYFLFKYQFGLEENFYVRMTAVSLCISLFFVHRLPDNAKRYLFLYWHACIIFILPFIFTYNLLITDFHELWRYWAIFMVCVVVVYVPNLLMILVDLVFGVLLAVGFYALTTPKIDLNPDFEVTLFSIVIVFTTFSMFLFSRYSLKGAQEHERSETLRALAASIAHEMRNPLAQLNLSLDAIGRRLPKYYPNHPPTPLSEAELDEIYLHVAHGRMAALRGGQVIDMILNEVRDRPIDAEDFAPLSAAQATRRAVEEYGYESPTERERVRLHLERDFEFRGDETLLVFVLFNLLKNALYCLRAHPEGRIDITLESGGEGNRLRFRDSGPGIAPEELAHLFDAFYTRGKEGGTGLGLAYCKRVMRAFGGDIQCESEPGRFTEFTLSFPARSGRSTAAPAARNRFPGKRLLLVDDDALQRATGADLLAALGAEVVQAGDGREALERLREGDFDLVMMDLNMPVMNGYEAAEAIRAGEAGEAARELPIVACSSEPEYIARGKTEKVGMQGLLSKPCGETQLIRELSRLLGPRSPSGARKPRAPSEGEGDGTGPALMVVEDSDAMRQAMALFFEGKGFEVLQAGDGREALELLARFHCDLVITDMSMPGMDGRELARRIRAYDDPLVAALPIIGLSGWGNAEEEAREAGMSRYLVKGEDLESMVKTIRELLPAPPGAPEACREGAVLDPEATAAALGVPLERLAERLSLFAAEYRDHPRRLKEAWAADEWGRLRELAHKVKGAARLLRTVPLEESALAVEGMARDEGRDGAEEAVKRLADGIDRLLRCIDALSRSNA